MSLDLTKACAAVRAFDDRSSYRLGPALVGPTRFPIDLWPPPPSPQASVDGKFPHHVPAIDTHKVVSSALRRQDSEARVHSWVLDTAVPMQYCVARLVTTPVRDRAPLLPPGAPNAPTPGAEVATPTDMCTSNLHTVGSRSSTLATLPRIRQASAMPSTPLSPSFNFDWLPDDPHAALEALEDYAQCNPLKFPASHGDTNPLQSFLSPVGDYDYAYDEHPFRAARSASVTPARVSSETYRTSTWSEVTEPGSEHYRPEEALPTTAEASHRRVASDSTEAHPVVVKHFHHHHYHHHHIHHHSL